MDKDQGDIFWFPHKRTKILTNDLFPPFSLCDSGLIRQPKWGHLRDVHKAIKLCEPALIATDPSSMSLGQNAEVTLLYKTSFFFNEKRVLTDKRRRQTFSICRK